MLIVLLPGLDGTGSLFGAFISSLPDSVETQIVSYPTQQSLSYQQLENMVLEILPVQRKFLLLAESFSGPIALQIADRLQEQVEAVILVSSFAYRPLSWIGALIARLPLEMLLKLPMPDWIIRRFLAGPDATQATVNEIRDVLKQVNPKVLANRLTEVLTSSYCCRPVSCTTSALAIHAQNDPLIGRVAIESIYSICPKAIMETIAAPHLVLQTTPGTVVQSLQRHGLLPER